MVAPHYHGGVTGIVTMWCFWVADDFVRNVCVYMRTQAMFAGRILYGCLAGTIAAAAAGSSNFAVYVQSMAKDAGKWKIMEI